MAIEQFYASTARNIKDVAQYLIYPLARFVAFAAFKDPHKANVAASVATSLSYAGLAWWFFGLEKESFDQNVRLAVAAELGKNPEDINFKDYYQSKNCIVQSRLKVFELENMYRYPIALLPIIPAIADKALKGSALRETGGGPVRIWRNWDTPIYAGVAAMWLGESYAVNKTAAYEIQKVRENEESVGKEVTANSLIAVYNRMRTDAGLTMLDTKDDRAKVWPLLERLAHLVNDRDHVNMPEVVYLMGMGKLNVFARDQNGNELHDASGHLILNPAAYRAAEMEIERVNRIGLKGIAQENASLHTPKPRMEPTDMRTNFKAAWMNAHHDSFRTMLGRDHFTPNEYISPRDLGDTPFVMP